MSFAKYGKVQKMTSALLVLIMFFVNCAMAETVQVRSAAIASEIITKNGMVRVYLSSLGNPSSLDLTVNGSYSLSTTGEFIADGSRIHISFSAGSGAISMNYQGRTVNMGKRFSIRRHSTTGNNGILIDQSRDSQNPYPGDISFEAVDSGGAYTLYVIAHIYIENYLYGVLPYEMGNSSGFEALKAQAVAARTYTVRMMEKRASGRYDVKDTTSDQVYRGTPSGNANCKAAVDATKGIVLMYGSDYITTYYSSSNGGQTETARTGTAYAYMKVKDDPFDYANPASAVKQKTIYADLSSAANPSGLVSLLKNKALSRLKRSGYPAETWNTHLLMLKNVTPHSPMYASPSRLYTKMDFTFSLSTANDSGQQETLTFTETCAIFSELESLLGMSIQSAQNELWSVEKNNGSFVLQARRYGHGMGMSQRGAMQMASQGYTYDQILGFYYEGCLRVRHSFTNHILSSSSDDQHITVEPPVDTEAENESDCMGMVVLSGNGSVLAIRQKPSSEARMIGAVENGARVDILTTKGSWYQIRYGETVGYVPAASVTVSGTPAGAEQAVSNIIGFAVVTANDYVNLRSGASIGAQVIGSAPKGSVLTVFSQNGSWAKVQYQRISAYVNTGYISSIQTNYPSESVSDGTAKARVITPNGGGTVNLRTSPSMDAGVVTRLNAGTLVTVLSDDGAWSYIAAQGIEGYMLSEFLRYTSASDAEDVPENDTEEPSHPHVQSAVVATESGSLNIRAQADAMSMVVGWIPKGESVEVLAWGNAWTAVRYRGCEGYVMTKYLSLENDPDDQPSDDSGDTQIYAAVNTPGGTLNLRLQPYTGSRILDRIPHAAVLKVLRNDGEWSLVEYLNWTGYVMNRFLDFDQSDRPVETPPEEDDDNADTENNMDFVQRNAWVHTAGGSLNLRLQPQLNAGVLTSIPQSSPVTVTAYGAEWCAVRYGAYEGYAMTRYLRFDAESSDDDSDSDQNQPEQNSEKLRAWVHTASGWLNMRDSANTNAAVLTTIPQYAEVTLLHSGTEWSRVAYNGFEGYVMSRYLSRSKPLADNESGPSADSGTQDEHSPYDVIGGVILDVTLDIPSEAMFADAENDTLLYSMCSENSDVEGFLPEGETVEVVLVGDIWCRVAYQDKQGYCLRNNLNVR